MFIEKCSVSTQVSIDEVMSPAEVEHLEVSNTALLLRLEFLSGISFSGTLDYRLLVCTVKLLKISMEYFVTSWYVTTENQESSDWNYTQEHSE